MPLLSGLNWKELSTWPRLFKNGLVLMVGVVVFIIAFMLLTRPQQHTLQTATAEASDLQQQLSLLAPKVTEQKRKLAELTELKAVIAQYSQPLPQAQQLNGIIETLARMASNAQLNLVLLKPKPIETEVFYAKAPIDIKVTGSYSQIAQFIDQVAHMNFYVYLHTLDVSRDPSQSPLTMTLNAELYYLIEPVGAAS